MTTYEHISADEFADRTGARIRHGQGKLECPMCASDSLSFKDDKNGTGVLLTCWKGCDREQLKRHYRNLSILPGGKQSTMTTTHRPPAPLPKPAKQLPKVIRDDSKAIAEYIYADLNGEPIARKLRMPPRTPGKKNMLWDRYEDGQWFEDLDDNHEHHLYQVSYARHALAQDPNRLLIIVEGEKDVDTAYDLGLIAVCNPNGGAESWKPAYTDQLSPATRICVIADADDLGRKHAIDVTNALTAAGKQVVTLELPEKDLTDYIEAGHTSTDLLTLIDALTPAAPESNPMMLHGAELNTEQCNAYRFSAAFGADTKYEGHLKQWYCWQDGIWAENDLIARTRARKTVELMFDELKQPMDDDVRKKLSAHVTKSQTANAQDGLLRLAQTLEDIQIHYSKFDRNPYEINCLNGLVDIRTGTLRPHDRDALCTQMAPVNYDPDAYCKPWEDFLHAIMLGNRDMVDYLQVCSGYSFTGSPICAAFFFCYGQGHNGKSTLIETLLSLAGTYGTTINKKHLMLKISEADASPGIAKLRRKRFASVSEVTPGDRLDEGTVKMLTGADSISARFLHKNEVEFTPTHHLWGMGNEKPIISGTDEGIWRRIHLIPFEHHFAAPDVGIKELFLNDTEAREGIFAWIVRGAHIWYSKNKVITKPARVLASNAEYRLEMDLIAQFLADCCITGTAAFEEATPLYKRYQQFVLDMGHHAKSQTKFGTYLGEHGFARRKSNSKTFWDGLTLLRD